MFTAHERMAALAKRYWGVQIQDITALQWDGSRHAERQLADVNRR